MKPKQPLWPAPQEPAEHAWIRSPNRWMLVLVGGLALTAALLWWPESPSESNAEEAGVYPSAPAKGSEALPAASEGMEVLPHSTRTVEAQRRGIGAFEVCGLGRISPPSGAPAEIAAGGVEALPAPVGSEPFAQARARLLASMAAQAAPRARVAAELLQRPSSDDESALNSWARTLLQRAHDSGDPVALAWAEEACGYLPGEGSQGQACRLRLIRERLRLEPDNGHHWAALADEDPSAADEAWQGLLKARRWHEEPQALVLAAHQALPPDVPGYLRLALGAEIGTRAGALPSPGEAFLQDRCIEAPLGRRAECENLAQMLVAHGDGTQTLALGLKVGRAAGWPTDRVKAVQAELEALASEPVRWQPDPAQSLSCNSVEAWQSHLAQVAAVGELQALRQRLAEKKQAR